VDGFAKSKDKRFTQPFLLNLMTDEQKVGDIYLILDNFSIPAGNDLVPALDLFFKAHYVFNLSYALPIRDAAVFIDTYVYGLESINSKVPPKLVNLKNKLATVKMHN